MDTYLRSVCVSEVSTNRNALFKGLLNGWDMRVPGCRYHVWNVGWFWCEERCGVVSNKQLTNDERRTTERRTTERRTTNDERPNDERPNDRTTNDRSDERPNDERPNDEPQ